MKIRNKSLSIAEAKPIEPHMRVVSDHISNDMPGMKDRRLWMIAGLTLMVIIAIAFIPRIPQSEAYHSFGDQRSLLGIPNCLDVISNLPFLVVGVSGLLFLAGRSARHRFVQSSERWSYVMFFAGVTLTCFGSAYYHLAPNTGRLMWDRLPMTIAFMSLLSAVIAERINLKAGLTLLLPLLLIGVASVVYWHLTEQSGNGDLRPYILVQFYSGLLIVLIVSLFPSSYARSGGLAASLFFYALAKAFELLDKQLFNLGELVSGHTVKHLSAAVSVCFILRMLKHRTLGPVALAPSQPVSA
jgi:hypothetical protein